MANIKVTAVSGKNYHKVDFGGYAVKLGWSYDYFWAEDIKRISKNKNNAIIELEMKSGDTWLLSYKEENEPGVFIVDEVAGDTEILSNDELATLLANLKG